MAFDLEKLLVDVFDPQEGEKVLIMCDLPYGAILMNDVWSERLDMVKVWRKCFKELGDKIGLNVYEILYYNATGVDSAPLPEYGYMGPGKVAIENILSQVNICLALTQYSATGPLITFAKEVNKTLRVASMPGISKSMEDTALSADYKEVARKCSILAPKLTNAVGATVYFSTGHMCYFDLRNREAEEDNGRCDVTKAGTKFPGINLPSGEACIAPYEGEDEGIGPSETDGLLPVQCGEELLVYKVHQNKIVEVFGNGPEAEKKRSFFAKDTGRRNVAELGLGCNNKAVNTGNVLESEKVEGVHWACGISKHLGGVIGVEDFEDPDNAVHEDTVYAKGSPIEIPLVTLEHPNGLSEEIIKNGEYVIF